MSCVCVAISAGETTGQDAKLPPSSACCPELLPRGTAPLGFLLSLDDAVAGVLMLN